MPTAIELLRQGRRDEIWKKYCGFIDLSLEGFMQIQERLLLEQIQLLSNCELGKKLLGGQVPTSVEEFREKVPLTTYEDYFPYLSERHEDALPRRPFRWACTSGRSGLGRKWAPYTREMYVKSNAYVLATLIFGSSRKKGDFCLEEGDIILYTLAPPPYLSGTIAGAGVLEHFPLRYIPSLEKAEKMNFQERIEEGFRLALSEGIDVFYGLASVLVRVGEQFEQGSGGVSILSILHPKAIFRISRALLKARLAKRRMLPKDLWDVKAIMSGGMDVAIFREKIERYWGKPPLEIYGGTEIGMISMQTWGDGLTFVPDWSFLEFIAEEEFLRSRQDPSYHPHTVLLDEVKPGGTYELVVTNFHGGAFVRYRSNDLIKILALRDEEYGIDIPQMTFHSRGDDVIDLASFARLTEGIVWQALAKAGIAHSDWTVRKESREEQPILHFYVERKGKDQRDENRIQEAIHENLKDFDPNYRDMEEMLGVRPLTVTILPASTFQRYYLEKQAAGADLAHLKPPHMKPSDEVINDLLRLSRQGA
jgi:hypothetical protein